MEEVVTSSRAMPKGFGEKHEKVLRNISAIIESIQRIDKDHLSSFVKSGFIINTYIGSSNNL